MIKKIIVLAILVALSLPAHATINVVRYWHLGESDPGAVAGGKTTSSLDSVGGNNLTFATAVTYSANVSPSAAAHAGSALSLLFTNGQFGTTAQTNLTGNFGLEFWVKANTTNDSQSLVYNGHTGGTESSGFGVFLSGTHYLGLLGGSVFVGSAPVNTNVWTHLALVRDGFQTTLYADGVAVGTTGNGLVPPAGNFLVGANNCYVDEVRLFTFATGQFSTNDLLLNRNLVVTTVADSGPGSLRQMVSGAAAGDVITFINTLSGATISLTSGQLSVSQSVTIDASGLANGIRINGNSSRIFQVNGGVTATFNALTLTNGFANNSYGGGVYNFGSLTLNQCAVANCSASDDGGGIYSYGPLTISNSTFSGCSCGGDGGALVIDGNSTLTVSQSTLFGNTASYGGAIFVEPGASMLMNQCTVSGNHSTTGNIQDAVIHNSGAESYIVKNSIIAGNSPNDGGADNVHNLAGGDARLGPLANNGGLTQTMLPLPGSAAIDAGDDSVTNTFATDQRGFPRKVGLHVDFGSVEAPDLPSAGTLPATDISTNAATLNAGVYPAGTNISYYFEYGTSTNYGNFTATNAIPAAHQAFTVSNVLNNLTSQTAYHFRVVASNADGIYVGSDQTFTTLRVLPLVVNANDSGPGSLRAMIAYALPGDVIPFAPNLSGQTILLTSGELLLTNNVIIDASALTNGIQINGKLNSRIFELTNNVTVVLKGLNLTNGFASLGGGIAVNHGSALTLSNTTIAGCFADYGGAINSSGSLSLNECTLSGNSAGALYGGAIEASGPVAVNQSTITGNAVTSGNGQGGGIYIVSGTLTLFNSIVAGNSASSGADILNFGSSVTRSGSNMVQSLSNTAGGTDSGPAPINAAPMLAPLAYYGGLTLTRPPLVGSPAIDMGNDSATSNFAFDQRGLPRKSGRHVDIGAVEFQAPLTVYSTGDFTEGSLRAALAYNPPGSVITFDPGLSGKTITLTSGEILLNNSWTIDGTAANPVSISGNGSSRIFEVASGTTTWLIGLTMTNGNSGNDGGGGIFNSGNLVVSNCSVVSNVSGSDGGGAINFGTMTVFGSTFANNISTSPFYEGGGIDNFGTLTVSQSTFIGNAANGGGAIFSEGGSLLMMYQSTIVSNNAYCCGGGITVYASSGNQTLVNSIVAGNLANGSSPSDLYLPYGALAVSNADLTAINPRLAPLGSYGGATPTMPPLPGSPAINAGSDAAASVFAYDQRGTGYPRVSGGHVDIGAVESIYSLAAPALLTGVTQSTNGTFRFSFTNFTGANFSVFTSTNVALPFAQWSNLGAAVETPPGSGQFQFTDIQATNFPQRYYRVTSP